MPPVSDPSRSKVDGLAFLGLSLARKSEVGHPASATHQQAFDLNEVQDRGYKYIFSTDDAGWLVGGGEPGPPTTYKLSAPDSAHVEILRIGTYRPEWGGVAREDIVEAIRSGEILVPEIEVLPTDVTTSWHVPPELEIRIDCPTKPTPTHLPVNWQLRFLHNQLFKRFDFPSRFCPGAHHSTILRKAEFRSEDHEQQYFEHCKNVIGEWSKDGPKPLVPTEVSSSIEVVKCRKDTLCGEPTLSESCKSGLWLFTDRNTITHQFLPNFLPPYDTPKKLKIIWEFLKEEWDEDTLTWKAVA